MFFDADEPVRSEKNAEAFKLLPDVQVVIWSPDEDRVVPVYCSPGISTTSPTAFELGFVHDKNESIYLSKGFVVGKHLLYSGAGPVAKQNGVVRGVSVSNPISTLEAKAIVQIVRELPQEQWLERFRRIWSSVPEVLLAWALSQHISACHLEIPIETVADAYNRLWSALQNRDSTLPPLCAANEYPSLENAVELLRAARMDI